MTSPTSTPLTGMESDFTGQITHAFHTVSGYSLQLLYILVAIDIAFIGILWMLKGSSAAKDALLRVVYIGFLFTLVLNFSAFLQIVINGFIAIGFTVTDASRSLIFQPDLLWNQAVNPIISLFSIAAQYGYSNIGVSIIYSSLGFFILLATLALVSSMVVYALQFYIIGLIQLVMLPFGALRLTQNLFFGATSQLIAAGARVCVMILTLGICLTTLASVQTTFAVETPIQQPLLLLAVTLVAAVLGWVLPAFAGKAVGYLKLEWGAHVDVSTSSGAVTVNASQSLSSAPGAPLPSQSPMSSMQAASAMSPVSVAVSGAAAQSSGPSQSPTSTSTGTPTAGDIESREVSQKASQRVEKNYKAFDDE